MKDPVKPTITVADLPLRPPQMFHHIVPEQLIRASDGDGILTKGDEVEAEWRWNRAESCCLRFGAKDGLWQSGKYRHQAQRQTLILIAVFFLAGIRLTAMSSERALGFGNVPVGPSDNNFGLRLQNNTGVTQTQFQLSYTGEQWRDTSTTANSLLFSWLVTAGGSSVTALGTTGYTSVSQLNFNSISNTNAGNASPGTPVATTNISFTVTGLNWQPGQDLWLRWTKPSNEHYLAVDNVSFQVIPEPSTFAMLLGGFGLLIGFQRARRKRSMNYSNITSPFGLRVEGMTPFEVWIP